MFLELCPDFSLSNPKSWVRRLLKKWNHTCRCLPREWKTFSYFCFVWVFGSKRNQYRGDLSKYHPFHDVKFCLSVGLRWMNLSQDGALINTLLVSKTHFWILSLGFPQFAFFKKLLIWKASTKSCLCNALDYNWLTRYNFIEMMV